MRLTLDHVFPRRASAKELMLLENVAERRLA